MIQYKVTDAQFSRYGKILDGYDFTALLEKMQATPKSDNVIYVPSDSALEELSVFKALSARGFGGLPIQIGYCNGKNDTLNAVEYHRSSEINIAVTDLILLLGTQQDIDADFHYDTSKMEAFFFPAGTAVEIYATTLHYAPCSASADGFQCVVVLPKNTNLPLENIPEKKGEDALLFAKNKWLIAHSDSGLEKDGAFIGLLGENLKLEIERR